VNEKLSGRSNLRPDLGLGSLSVVEHALHMGREWEPKKRRPPIWSAGIGAPVNLVGDAGIEPATPPV
jgi:hypothetical protein